MQVTPAYSSALVPRDAHNVEQLIVGASRRNDATVQAKALPQECSHLPGLVVLQQEQVGDPVGLGQTAGQHR